MRIRSLVARHETPARPSLSRNASATSEQFFDDDLVERARAQAARWSADAQAAARARCKRVERMPLTQTMVATLKAMSSVRGGTFVLVLGPDVLLTPFGLRTGSGAGDAENYQGGRVANAPTNWLPFDPRALDNVPNVADVLTEAAGNLRERAVCIPFRRRDKDFAPSTGGDTIASPAAALAVAQAEHLALRRIVAQPRIFAHAVHTSLQQSPLVQALMRSLGALDKAYDARHALRVYGHTQGLYLTAEGFRKARAPHQRLQALRRRRFNPLKPKRPLRQNVLPWHARNTRRMDGASDNGGGLSWLRMGERGKYFEDLALEDGPPTVLDWDRHRDAEEALSAVETVLAGFAGRVEQEAARVGFGPQARRSEPLEKDLLPSRTRTSQVSASLVALAGEEATRLQSLIEARQRAPKEFLAFLRSLERQPITKSLMQSLRLMGRASGHPVGLHDSDLPLVLTAAGFRTLVAGARRTRRTREVWGPFYYTSLGTEALPWFYELEDAKRRVRTQLSNAAMDLEAHAKQLMGRAGLKDRMHVWLER